MVIPMQLHVQTRSLIVVNFHLPFGIISSCLLKHPYHFFAAHCCALWSPIGLIKTVAIRLPRRFAPRRIFCCNNENDQTDQPAAGHGEMGWLTDWWMGLCSRQLLFLHWKRTNVDWGRWIDQQQLLGMVGETESWRPAILVEYSDVSAVCLLGDFCVVEQRMDFWSFAF